MNLSDNNIFYDDSNSNSNTIKTKESVGKKYIINNITYVIGEKKIKKLSKQEQQQQQQEQQEQQQEQQQQN